MGVELRSAPADYRDQMRKLLPKGPVWGGGPGPFAGSVFEKLFDGMAEEWSRIHNRALDLLEEADPRTASQMINAWERNAGVPDDCDPATGLTLPQRRLRVLQKITSRGGQRIAYYIEVAAVLGIPITIEEFRPRQYGTRAPYGQPYYDAEWWFAWRVTHPAAVVEARPYGESLYGGPYRDFGNLALQCILNKLKPAHTKIIFALGPILIDYGLITEPVGETVDHGLITDAVGETVDHGSITDP